MNKKVKTFFKTHGITVFTLIGVLLGIALGMSLREVEDSENYWTSRRVSYINFPGELFLRMLKGLIIPLIVSSLISAVGSLDLSVSRKIGGWAVCYYVTTTILAVILGIILVTTIEPGKRSSDASEGAVSDAVTRNITTADTLLDLVRNLFAPNWVQACIQQFQTLLIDPKDASKELSEWKVDGIYIENMNILGLVIASIALGIAMSVKRAETTTLLGFFSQTAQTMMVITQWIIYLTPIGVLSLVAAKLIEIDSLGDLFQDLGLYFVTVAGGILFHGFVVLPIIYFIFVRKNPYIFIKNLGQPLATAFGTSSSAATLPITIQCLEDNNIDPRITRFVLPIGATINMDGTALYEAVAAIFIAQQRDKDLSFSNILAVSITATAASIGAAGIPQAGLVTLVMVLDTLGLPAEDVALIIAVDWLLDRFRTVVNVLGDSFGAAIISHYSDLETLKSGTEVEDASSRNAIVMSNGIREEEDIL